MRIKSAAAWCLVALAACRTASPTEDVQPDDIVLATVNGVSLTLGDAMDTFVSSHAGHGILVSGEPAVRELAGRLVEQQLLFTEAEVLGVTEIEGLKAAVETYRRKAAEIAYWRGEVDDKMDVSDEEVEAFYAKSEVALDLTMVQCATREEAEALRARVADGADMGELAAAESIHPSSEFGGALTSIQRGMLGKDMEEVAFGLEQPGELSPVFETEEGFAFLRLEGRLQNLARPAREVALPQIRSVLESQRREELREAARAAVRERAGVRVHGELVTKAALTGEEAPETVVAESAGQELTLGDLRVLLDPDAVGRASEEEASAAGVGIADRWAMEQAMDAVLAETGHLEDPEVAADTRAFRKSAVLGTLHRDYVYADISIEESEVREHYEANRERYKRPAEYLPTYVLCDTEEEARGLLERVEAGEDLGDLAMEHSIDRMSAAHGGQIGWIREGDLLPEVSERLAAMEPGDVAGPIETEIGWFVVTLRDRRPSIPMPFEKAKSTIRRELTELRQAEARAAWAERLRERADVQIHDEGIARAAAWLEQRAAEQGKSGDAPAPPHGVDEAGAPGPAGAGEAAA